MGVSSVRPIWKKLAGTANRDPEAIYLYTTGYDQLRAIQDEVQLFRNAAVALSSEATASTCYFVNATNTTAAFMEPTIVIEPLNYTIFPSVEQQTEFIERLSHLDPEIGNVFRAISEILYGTRSAPERAALYLMRQAFDHFFGKLAPDDQVRESPYWTEKKGDKPNQITREERIQYVAGRYIDDETRKKTLLATSRHMLAVYQALNKAHSRGTLNESQARRALKEMQSFLEEWANLVGI